MANKNKKSTKSVAVENEVLAQTNVVANEETQTVEQNEIQKAQEEADRLKELLKQAKEKLALAKEADRLDRARPFRTSKFVVCVFDADELNYGGYILDDEVCGSPMMESDVHYRAEKACIDQVKSNIEEGHGGEYIYLLYKVHKESGKAQLISKVYMDTVTTQVVID